MTCRIWRKRRIKCVLKQLPRVLEVGFGVGAGAGQTLEGLVQNRNNPLLFFERREGDWNDFERRR